MAIFALIFYVVHCSAPRSRAKTEPEQRKINHAQGENSKARKKKRAVRAHAAKPTPYWYLRHGYIFVAKNYMPHGVKGELNVVGHDGETLAFVEVRTRTIREAAPAQPELSVNAAKQKRPDPHRAALPGRPPHRRRSHALRRTRHRQHPRPPAIDPPAQKRLQSPTSPLQWPPQPVVRVPK